MKILAQVQDDAFSHRLFGIEKFTFYSESEQWNGNQQNEKAVVTLEMEMMGSDSTGIPPISLTKITLLILMSVVTLLPSSYLRTNP